jgi:hypothetical protein
VKARRLEQVEQAGLEAQTRGKSWARATVEEKDLVDTATRATKCQQEYADECLYRIRARMIRLQVQFRSRKRVLYE